MTDNVRYQVFISSTFEDLKNERRSVIECLLGQDYFPSGMEFFPSTNIDQFDYIKDMIDQSDFVIVIVKGRYGSGYTEKEFDYSINKGKIVLVFMYEPFDSIQSNLLDLEEHKRSSFKSFRDKLLKNRLVRKWTNESDLLTGILTSLKKNQCSNDELGWVRRSCVVEPSTVDSIIKENLKLKDENNILSRLVGTGDLVTGDDVIIMSLKDGSVIDSEIDYDEDCLLSFTCNEVIRYLRSELTEGIPDLRLQELIKRWLSNVKFIHNLDDDFVANVKNIITIQSEALGVIQHYTSEYYYNYSEDEGVYLPNVLFWRFTDKGYSLILASIALKKRLV